MKNEKNFLKSSKDLFTMQLKEIRELDETINEMSGKQRNLYKGITSVSCAINNI